LDQGSLSTRYSGWFYAAAIYNLLWGSVNILFPRLFFELVRIPAPSATALWQVLGMFVLVLAPAYWWLARRPYEHRHFILIALLGKTFGPLGFAWSLSTGALPLAFGWTILTNDLIWWPAFWLFLRDAIRLNGLLPLLRGE
jgi:hypothetical protein